MHKLEPRNRKVKVLATIGPASRSPEMLAKLLRAGADAFRVNMSHGAHSDHAATIKAIRDLEKTSGRPIAILADLQGPKLRVGTFANGPVTLVEGAPFRLDLDRTTPGDATRAPLPYAGDASISTLFQQLESRYGWTPLREGDNVIGLTRNGANISLEPGGPFELSGAAFASLKETDAELRNHLDEVGSLAGPLGIGFMGIGAAPEWRHEDMPVMPKGRYRLMTDYMGRVGTHGTQMMYRTCTVQVNLDFASEADMVQKLRVSLALQPLGTALFANFIFLLKETTVASAVAVPELLYTTKNYIALYYKTYEMLAVLTLMCVLIFLPLSLALRVVERRLQHGQFGH